MQSRLQKALELHQAGQYRTAAELYEQVLRTDAENAEALHLSGLIAHQTGKIDEAIARIEHAVRLRPQSTTYLNNLCAVLVAANRPERAAKCYETVVTLNPEDRQAWFGLGNSCHRLGRFDDAIQAYRRVLQFDPQHVGALHNMGAAYHAHGDQEQALLCLQRAVCLQPGSAQIHCSLGNVYRAMGALHDAESELQKAIEIQPDFIDARFNLGNLFKDSGNARAAADTYIALVRIAPSMAEAHNNLGNVYYSMDQAEPALKCYRAALELKPEYPEALHNMSIVFQDLGQYDNAMAQCRKAISLKSDYDPAYASLVHQMRQACAWKELEKVEHALDRLTRQALAEGRPPAENPFLNLSRHADPALNLAVARAWSREVSHKIDRLRTLERPGRQASFADGKPAGRLRVGYLSNNFRNHPTAHLLSRLFELHDRNRFEVYGYSYGPNDASDYRKRIEQGCDRFIELGEKDDDAASNLIRNDKINILVDLVGYMKNHRLGICARRPAPIQVRYLGMAGTTGADFFDYIVADRVVVPEEHTPFYSEKLVYMPHCYQINDDQQPIAGIGYARSDFALPADGVVYCSFASHYKLDPVMFAAWMRILQGVPLSVLWLTPGSKIAEQNLRTEAEAHGVDPGRLVFADRMPKDQHLARLKLADLALDTRLVGGAATTSDALWSSVPVITLQGTHFASRMSASILRAAGLEELITNDLEEYEALAVRLGSDLQELENLKQKTIRKRTAGRLFNTETTVKNLEHVFRRMWEDFAKGQKPKNIGI